MENNNNPHNPFPQQDPPVQDTTPRSAHVKEKFVVHIEDEDLFPDVPQDFSDAPTYKGEVYFSNPPTPTQTPTARTPSPAARNPARKPPKISKAPANLAILVIIISLSVLLSLYAISCLGDVLAINRSHQYIADVTIATDMSTNEIIDELHDAKLIKRPIFCKMFYSLAFRLKNLGVEEPKQPEYIAGAYYVNADLGLEGMLNKFRIVATEPKTVGVTFPEGMSVYQMFQRLDEAGVCKSEHLYAALEQSEFSAKEFPFLTGLTKDASRTQMLEGYLFPDTYEFFQDENANVVIRTLLERFGKAWTEKYNKRAKELGYSVDEIIIMASIIEREAADTEQMAGISAVLHNRLKNPVDYTHLGFDSTSDYITNIVAYYAGEEAALPFQVPYNTSKNEGLPPGPICNPGEASIKAALYPSDSNATYFLHDSEGNIYYANSEREHNINRSKAGI